MTVLKQNSLKIHPKIENNDSYLVSYCTQYGVYFVYKQLLFPIADDILVEFDDGKGYINATYIDVS